MRVSIFKQHTMYTIFWDNPRICGGIDAKNVIVHMVTINQELRHEQIVVFNMIDPKFFARIYFCKIAAFNSLRVYMCMWDISAKYYAIFYHCEGTIFANAKYPRSCLAYKTGFTKRRYANPMTPR